MQCIMIKLRKKLLYTIKYILIYAAYVAGEKEGLVQERPFRDGETLCDGTHLDMDLEITLARDLKKQMQADPDLPPKEERKAMKDLGLTRFWSNICCWLSKFTYTCVLQVTFFGQIK